MKSGRFALAACFFATAAPAQDVGNGLTLSVSQNLSYSNNINFDVMEVSGLRATSGLNLAYSSETRVQGIQFTASTNAQFGSDDDAENSFTDPIFGLSYRRESKNAGLAASANFRQAEINTVFETEGMLGSGFVTVDSGVQTDLGYSVGLDFGRTDPVSGSITFTGNMQDYSDTADPDLLDNDTHSVAAQVNLRFDPRITGRITANLTESKEDGGLNRNTSRFGIGATFAVSQTLSVDASANIDETERTDFGGATVTSKGLGFTVSATQDMKNGAMTANISSNVNENGRRTSLNFSRNLELKTADLDFSIGGVKRDDADGFDPTYSIGLAQELPRDARFNLVASQAFETNGSGEEAINSRISTQYSTALTDVSSLSATMEYRDTNGLSEGIDDAARVNLSVSYTHSLSQDWGLTGGYSRSFASQEGELNRTSDTVFVGLQKTFEWKR